MEPLAEKNAALYHLASHRQPRPHRYTPTPPSQSGVILPSVDNVYTAHDLSSQRRGKGINKLIYDRSLYCTMRTPLVLSETFEEPIMDI